MEKNAIVKTEFKEYFEIIKKLIHNRCACRCSIELQVLFLVKLLSNWENDCFLFCLLSDVLIYLCSVCYCLDSKSWVNAIKMCVVFIEISSSLLFYYLHTSDLSLLSPMFYLTCNYLYIYSWVSSIISKWKIIITQILYLILNLNELS